MSGGWIEDPLEVRRESIPRELKAIDAWAVWHCEADDRGHVSKPPYQAAWPHERAWPSSPETWASFEDAYAAYRRSAGRWSGVSFALADWGIVGIDLDHVSEHLAEAARIVEILDSYTEITPGKDGFRVFVKGYLPPGRRIREWIEVYQVKRFLTVTGAHIDRFPREILERQEQLEWVWSEFVSYAPVPA